ncbi:MAG: hypothetical protein IPI82_16565 [Candidatus Microthrix sp.]|nr:hypothetical protein [Candidatus Microthrix sp.]MBK7323997.1 hypothetical protein [Candidatus Microthrix sp.]
MGERHGVGKDTIARIWRARKLRPWKVDTFGLSNDPDFEEKLVDVVGLYEPPEAAAVFSFDEKPVPGVGPHPEVVADDPRPEQDNDL